MKGVQVETQLSLSLPLSLPLWAPRTWFDLAHSDSNFFPTVGGVETSGRACRGDNSPRVISVWLRNQKGGGKGRLESNIRGGLGTRGKNSRGGGKEKKNGDPRRVHPFCFWEEGEGEGPPLSLIKLNRNLISMGNVSTNWLGKDLCEWGTRLHVARWCTTYGLVTNGKGWRGSKERWLIAIAGGGWIVLFFLFSFWMVDWSEGSFEEEYISFCRFLIGKK